jgi:ubiquitin C-terminal hydrolase
MSKNSEKKKKRRERKRRQKEEEHRRQQLAEKKEKSSEKDADVVTVSDQVVSSLADQRPSIGILTQEPKPESRASFQPFMARKRQLTPVGFVYPTGKQEQPKQYIFGSFQPQPKKKQQETKTAHHIPLQDASSKKKNESIEDILFGNKRPRKESIDSTTPKSKQDQLDNNQLSVASADKATPQQGHLTGQTVADVVRDKQGLRPRANSTDGELMLPQRGLCDERKVLEAHKWNLSKHQLVNGTPKGFTNLGNTCFLNSTLQCLAFLPPFCQTLFTLPDDHRYGNGNSSGHVNGKKDKLSQGKRITLLLRALFRQVHRASGSNLISSIAPRAIVQAVPLLGSIGSRNGHKFRPGRQEDAHEFLVHLLDAMNDGELREAGINQHASGWRDRLPVARLDETTLLRRIFGGYLRNEVKCTQCGKKSKTYDPFLDLSLEVSNKACNSIADAVREFTRKETLDSQNRWRCPSCKKLVCATKQLTVFRPPLALCIQLKRFTFSGGMSFGGSGFPFQKFVGGGKKITKPIEFPASLDLPLSDGRSCGYALTGLVIHVGGSASSGHYTAYVNRPGETGSSKWFHMDDSFVEAVSESTVLQQRDAYILFYCRREVKLEFPSPPMRNSMTAEEATQLARSRARARADSLDGTKKKLDTTEEPPSERAPPNGDRKIAANVLEAKSIPATGHSASDIGSTPSNPNSHSHSPVVDVEFDEDSSDSESDASSQSNSSGSKSTVAEFKDTVQKKDDQPVVTKPLPTGQSLIGPVARPSNGKDALNLKHETDSKSLNKTRIVVSRGTGRERVEVMLGPRRKAKAWKPRTANVISKDDTFHLLGNQKVDAWNDGDDSERRHDNNVAAERTKLLSSIEKKETKRKRESVLDRWDAALDVGKQKKVKVKRDSVTQTDPRNNMFQKIQSDVLNMFHKPGKFLSQKKKKGKKGLLRR